MKLLPWLIAGIVLTTVPASGRADYILSLSTSADANHLQIGDSVTFDVSLSGIGSSNSDTYLSYLAATISYDNSLLSPNPVVTPGAIVPDITGFVGTGLPDAADAFYDGVFLASTPISDSGTFFSFQVTATKVGSGTLSFTAAAATLASDPVQTDQFTPETINLNFQIVGSSGVTTPEPSTLVLLISSMLGLSVRAGLRRLARRLRLGQSAVTASTG
jgi:hypothetical protein